MSRNEKNPKEEFSSLSPKELEYIRYLRDRKGVCPDDRALTAYGHDQLNGSEMTHLQEHVSVCGICQATLRIMREDENPEGTTAPEVTGDWSAIERKLDQRFAAFLRQREKPSPPNAVFQSGFIAGLKRLVLSPVLAYILVIAMMYPAYRGLFQKKPVEPGEKPEPIPIHEVTPPTRPGIVSTPQLSLEPQTRGGGGGDDTLSLRKTDAYFTISFFVPLRKSRDLQYDVQIKSRSGAVISEEKSATSFDGLGNFILLCPSELFREGRYSLHVLERQVSTGASKREFRFDFRLAYAQ